MFGYRRDGKKVKALDGVTRIMPMLMPNREGAVNLFKLELPAEKIDEYIQKKYEQGIEYSFRDVAIAILVRIYKIRPKLNRFIAGGRYYQRNHIDFSMMVHKDLRQGDNETVVKCRFTGYETIDEVSKKFNAEIDKSVNAQSGSDPILKLFAKAPLFMLKLTVSGLRFFDRLGLLTDKFMYNVSPFHTSIFLADLKSIKMPYIYHHLYNFGNCGFFMVLGKETMKAIVNADNQIVPTKIIECGISVDDRVMDGLSFNRMLKSVSRIIDDLSVLERPLEESEIFHENSHLKNTRG